MNKRVLVLPVVLASGLCHAQSGYVEKSFLGPEVGVFFPSGSQVKGAIGDRWTTFGMGEVSVTQVTSSRRASGFNVITGSGNGSKVYLLGYTMGVTMPFGDAHRDQVIPFLTVRAGGAYMDYAVQTAATTRLSGKRFGLTANAEAGLLVSGRVSVSARYDVFSPQDGLSFDGLSLRLTYGIAGF